MISTELLPIVLSCAVWGPLLAQHKLLFQCDNSGVVVALQKGSARDSTVLHLLHLLWFFVAHYGTYWWDRQLYCLPFLSRHNMHSFFSINPQASPIPTPVSPLLLQLLTPSGSDWTSYIFRQLFLSIIKEA